MQLLAIAIHFCVLELTSLGCHWSDIKERAAQLHEHNCLMSQGPRKMMLYKSFCPFSVSGLLFPNKPGPSGHHSFCCSSSVCQQL